MQALVHQFYNQRRAQARTVYPNAAHHAIADFASQHTGTLILITQNVDSLHKQAEAGLTMPPGYKLLHMHGELNKARCIATDTVHEWHDDMDTSTSCPCCHKPGCLRPHIVWFGEMPLSMDIIPHYVHHCDLFISIGTSGNVYPAAGFVQQVRLASQGHTVEINMEPSHGHTLFHQKIYGPATKTVPEFFNSL